MAQRHRRRQLDHAARPGLRLDTGGTGKGLAADLLAHRLDGRWAVDCGGDLRVSAEATRSRSTSATRSRARRSARCSSRTARSPPPASTRRLWRAPDGTPRHHLLDPSTGTPAWTGLVRATALAPTALEAEALAKAALLSGPRYARRWLRRHGGLIVHDDGEVECFGMRPVVEASGWRA